MADDVEIEIILEEDGFFGGDSVIITNESGVYTYSLDEVDNDVIDNLILGDAEYTVYSQEEILDGDSYAERYQALNEIEKRR